jgi:hypothetical protein
MQSISARSRTSAIELWSVIICPLTGKRPRGRSPVIFSSSSGKLRRGSDTPSGVPAAKRAGEKDAVRLHEGRGLFLAHGPGSRRERTCALPDECRSDSDLSTSATGAGGGCPVIPLPRYLNAHLRQQTLRPIDLLHRPQHESGCRRGWCG